MLEHTNKQFHVELESARSMFLQMGGLVEAMVLKSSQALSEGDIELAEQVREDEKRVNELEIEIDERISQLIARNQPTAIDLRLLLSISKMLTDMERCGDEAAKVAKMARKLHEGNPAYEPVVGLTHIAEAVAAMVHAAMDTFAREDAVAAAQVVRSDKAVDKEWKAALRQIISYMIEDSRTISHSINLIFIAHALERIGDHAKNMAERVIYLVHGDDVRHQGVANAERMARGEAPQPRT